MLKSVQDPQIVTGEAETSPPRRGVAGTALRAIVQAGLMVAVLVGSYVAMERLIAAAPERTGRSNHCFNGR